jgi:glycine cleavage system H lipoate-binding protein
MIEDSSYLPNLRKPTVDRVSGFGGARDYYYHHGHAWARVEYGGRVRVGIDDFALRLLGPQDEIQLPALGSTVGQSRPSAILKRLHNEALLSLTVRLWPSITTYSKASTANEAPYSDGWLMVIQPEPATAWLFSTRKGCPG